MSIHDLLKNLTAETLHKTLSTMTTVNEFLAIFNTISLSNGNLILSPLHFRSDRRPCSETMLRCSSVRVFLYTGTRYRRRELVSKFNPFDHQEIFPLCHSGQTGDHSAGALTIFPAFSADLDSIDYFRSVDRRHETKIVQN